MVGAVLFLPVPQGGGDPAEGFAHGGAGGPARALVSLDSFFDELQGAGLELGTAPLWHDPFLLEEVGRNEPQGLQFGLGQSLVANDGAGRGERSGVVFGLADDDPR